MITIENTSNVDFEVTLPNEQVIPVSSISQIVTTEILDVSKVKSSDKTILTEGEIATQTVTIKNLSSLTLTDVFFRDTLSLGATYVLGSVVVDLTPQPTYDLLTGFALPDIAPQGEVLVSYRIKANNPKTQSPVTNYAMVSYTVEDPQRGKVNYAEFTNTVVLAVVSKNITVLKSVDKKQAKIGDILTYSSIVTNGGESAESGLIFSDQIPSGTTFIEHSVEINTLNYPSYNPSTGFVLPSISAGESVLVTFKVVVI